MPSVFRKILYSLFICLYFLSAKDVFSQVVNGNFSAGGTGWISTAPPDSSLTYTGNQLTTVSDDDGVGTNSRTFASQSLTTSDPGFMSWLLVSYTGTDVDGGAFDHPIVLLGSTFYWINTAGGIQTTGVGAIDNDDSGITNLAVWTTLTSGTRDIGAGVNATDAQLGPGTAIWDDIDFQEITQSPVAQVVDEDDTVSFSPQVATNGAASIAVTLTVTNGTITLGSTAGITITGGGDGTATISFNGTPAQVNAAMSGLTYTPTPNFNGSDTLVFTATGGGITDTDNIGITVNPVPDFAFTITKDVDAANISSLVTLNYTIEVENTGDTAFTSPVLADSLVQNGTGQTLTSGPTLTAATDTDSDGEVDVGETWEYLVTYAVTQANVDDGNDLVNTATFSAAGVTAQSDSATTTITQTPLVTVTKTADLDTNVPAGQDVTYTYVVTNTGNVTLTNINLDDNVTAGSGPNPVPTHAVDALTDIPPLLDSNDGTPDNGIWDTLAPGDIVTFTGTYTVTQNDVDTLQ